MSFMHPIQSGDTQPQAGPHAYRAYRGHARIGARSAIWTRTDALGAVEASSVET